MTHQHNLLLLGNTGNVWCNSSERCRECGGDWIKLPHDPNPTCLSSGLLPGSSCTPGNPDPCCDARFGLNQCHKRRLYGWKCSPYAEPEVCCSLNQGTCKLKMPVLVKITFGRIFSTWLLSGLYNPDSGYICLRSEAECIKCGMYWIIPSELGNCLPEKWTCSPSTHTCCGDLQCLTDSSGNQKCYKEDDEDIILPLECCSEDQGTCKWTTNNLLKRLYSNEFSQHCFFQASLTIPWAVTNRKVPV